MKVSGARKNLEGNGKVKLSVYLIKFVTITTGRIKALKLLISASACPDAMEKTAIVYPAR